MTNRLSRSFLLFFGSITICVTCLLLLVFPDLWGTQYIYLDIINGSTKDLYVSLGRNYRVEKKETAYSTLVNDLGLREPPEWLLAAQSEMGARRWFFPQEVSFIALKTQSGMCLFPRLVEINVVSNIVPHIMHIRHLAKSGDGEAVENYVNSLWEHKRPAK